MSDRLSILLVEDNAGDARLLREMFSSEPADSFEIVHMQRLGPALNRLGQGGVDVVLLDLGLPDGNGVENVRRVRMMAPEVPVIVLSGRDDDATVAQSMLEGAQDYLVKGQIETRALPRALRHAIERFSLLRKTNQVNMELERRVFEKDILLSEIHHRVKNSLQVVSSLLSLEAARVSDAAVAEMLMTTQNRIRSMAAIHQVLYQSRDFARVDFNSFLCSFAPTLIQSFSQSSDRVVLDIDVEDFRLPIDAAIPCGLIVNELISNALKHAFPGGRRGTIRIEFKQVAGAASLSVSDDGVGIPASVDFDRSQTLGVQLVYLLAGQIGGKVSFERANPTRFTVSFPLE